MASQFHLEKSDLLRIIERKNTAVLSEQLQSGKNICQLLLLGQGKIALGYKKPGLAEKKHNSGRIHKEILYWRVHAIKIFFLSWFGSCKQNSFTCNYRLGPKKWANLS